MDRNEYIRGFVDVKVSIREHPNGDRVIPKKARIYVLFIEQGRGPLKRALLKKLMTICEFVAKKW